MIARRTLSRSGLFATGRHVRATARLLPAHRPLLFGALAAMLVFLATLALAVALGAGRVADDWRSAVADTATLAVIAEEAEIEPQARAALDILRETPGIRGVRVMDPADQRALLAPWLGTEIAFDAPELPLMIDVEADRRVLDREVLAARLAAEVPGAVFEDHSAWRLPLAEAAAAQRTTAWAAVALLVMALASAAALAARAALASAGSAIATLRAVGMEESAIGRVILARIAGAALVAGAVGCAAALLVVGGGSIPPTAGLPIGFSGWQWLLAPALVAVATLASLAAALVATRKALGEPL
jgi:cell division transport system permease protein